MHRQGLPLQEEQSPDSSLQEQQFSQHQQRRSENLPQPWQDEARSLSLQEQSSQQQQRRSENLPYPWQDEAQNLSLQEQFPQQQQTRSQNPYELLSSFQVQNLSPLFFQVTEKGKMQSVYDRGQYYAQNIQYENYTIPRYVPEANLNLQASGQYMFTEQGYNIESQSLSQQVTYNQQSQAQMLQALSKKDEVSQDFSQDFSYMQSMQNLQLHQTSDSDQQLEANKILNTPQHIPHVLSQNLQHAQEIHLQQHRVYSDQQSIQASNQLSRMEQQRRQDKSQKSAIQSHPQHQISQQQQLRYFQQHQEKKDQQQRSWDQSVQASNQWSHVNRQRRRNKSQQSATQSHPQHQISQRRSENLPQPWQDEARSLSLHKQSSQQQQQLKSFQQHQVKKDQQQRSWDQSVQASNQQPYMKQQHRQDKSQQQQFSSYQPQRRKDQQQRIWNQQQQHIQPQHIRDNNMQQQQQITPDTLAALSQLTLKGTRELDMASSTIKDCQARIPKRQKKQPSSETAFITVDTNMFKIIFKNNFLKKAIHYDVDITLRKDAQTILNRFPKALCRKIFAECRLQHFKKRYPAFDGRKNAYSAYDLPFKSNPNIFETIVEISTCNERCSAECNRHLRKFKVILKKVAEIDLSWTRNLPSSLDEVDGYQTGIQVLDIIMRHKPELEHINVGRSFFWPDKLDDKLYNKEEFPQTDGLNVDLYNKKCNLTGGLNTERGGFLSVILGQQIYLNVDVVHKAFILPQKVDTLFYSLHYDNYAINKLLKDLKVTYKIPRSVNKELSYRLDGIGRKLNEQKFIYKEPNEQYGTKLTVANYFLKHYKHPLKNPDWPCLVVKGQQIYLPPELCTIVSGQSVKKLNDEQTSKMIKETAMTALERKEEIEEIVFDKLVNNNNEIMEHEFQLSVEEKMETVKARILNAPNIIYANRKVNVSKGTWQMQGFKQPINLEKNQWAILCISDKNEHNIFNKMTQFMEKLIYHAENVGIRVGNTNTDTDTGNTNTDTGKFKCFLKKSIDIKKYFQENKKFKLIIVIIPNSPGTIYNEIKQIAELELGILTQCIKFSNFNNVVIGKNSEKSIIKNILLKINTKLNGINHTLDPRPKCFEKICMFVGADVTHPSYDEDKPSIAAVTASNDIDGLQYNVIHKVLPSKQEIIMDLKNIIDVQLSIYKDKTSRLPERIIYYRDGVSEGQLPQVMHYEIEAIRDAYKNKCKCDIEITCLIVQKRHHVRLFPTCDSRGQLISDDKNKNVKAGTIVDSEITHPSHFDFYLVSHASIQGTARPTKYKCICNDSNFTENEIEELTYYLCHMYARCTRTVSYPVPTYYAHLAAYRGKVLLHGYSDNDDRLREIQERFNTKMANLPMYFV